MTNETQGEDAFRPKVLVTKIGFDGHDRGSRVVAAALRDSGCEVVYTPPWQQIEHVVKLASEEDVDLIGISTLATDHLIVPKLMQALKQGGLGAIPVVVGGIVPDAEVTLLTGAGVAKIYHPGAPLDDICRDVWEFARESRRVRDADLWPEDAK